MATRPTENEQVWFDAYYGDHRGDAAVVAPEIIRRYKDPAHPNLFHLEMLHHLIGDVRGKRILYLGCGSEISGVLFALRGAEVWATDLSCTALQLQQTLALANGVPASMRHVACSAGSLPFGDRCFDIVFGIGILHHLQYDLHGPCAEIGRVLKPAANAFFFEPVVPGRLVVLLRSLFNDPEAYSPHCRPLTNGAVTALGQHFDVKGYPYMFVSRFGRFVVGMRADGTPHPLEFVAPWRKGLVYLLHYLDYLIFRLPHLRALASANVFKLDNRQAV